jgi:tRNA (guanine37-N1)-methyltransferase
MQSPCIRVPREQGENIRQELLKEGILRIDLKIKQNNDFIYLPIIKDIRWKGYAIKTLEFNEYVKESYIDIARESMPLDKIPKSFDIIGDIGIIRVSDEQMKYVKEIGDALLKSHNNLNVILIDEGVKNDFRLRRVTWVAGEKRTETVLKEYGMKLWVDIAQVYYSPRLSSERYRVACQIKAGSIIIDMFAGVAPFSILIAKIANPKKIYAFDINPSAVHYAKKNVLENKVDDKIVIFTGDAREILPELNIKADHIIMNLPHSAQEFLRYALPFAKMIHYYTILNKEEIDMHLKKLQNDAQRRGYLIRTCDIRIIGSYSPTKNRVGIDLQIKEG